MHVRSAERFLFPRSVLWPRYGAWQSYRVGRAEGIKLHRLLLGEGVRGPRARGLEARVGVHGLIRWGLLIGVLWQEGDGRVGRSGLGLGEVFHVADTLVAHVFGRVQHPLWTPPGVL